MAGFLGRWLGDSIRLGLALFLTLSAMQLPGLADAYQAGLRQAAEATARDLAERERIARDYYRLPEQITGPALVEALRGPEPANAEGLRRSAARLAGLRAAHAEMAAAPGLLRPLVAFRVAVAGAEDAEAAVLATAYETYIPRLLLNTAGAIYGLGGLMLGLLLAHLLTAPFRRRQPAPAWR